MTGVFDIECAEWDRFVCGAYLDASGYHESWSESDFASSLLSRSGVYYAHSGGRYDTLWLLDQCAKRELAWSATMAGSRVLSAKIGALELRDSAALMPMSLKEIAPMGGAAKIATGLVCDCGPPDCGGYCRLGRLTAAERLRVSEYLETDCRALLAAIDGLHCRAAADGILLAQTVGGSAWKTAADWLSIGKATHSVATYHALSEGRYGGRCEVYRTRGDCGHRHDIHASYPAALSRVALPIGTPRAVTTREATAAWTRGDAGIYWVDLRVPEDHVAPLPVRIGDRLVYPWGPVSGAWTRVHLLAAIRHGATILRVTRAHVWPESAPVLAPFARRVWDLRDRNARSADAGDVAYSAWLKWLANSLTGKLAQSPEHETLRFIPTGTIVDKAINSIHRNRYGDYVAEIGRRPLVDACAHVEWYAYLVADASAMQYDAIAASADPWYGDTDSLYSGDRMLSTGDALGEWGYEGAAIDWHARAPKIYSYRCGGVNIPGCKKHPNGAAHVRGKGLSGLTSEGLARLDVGAARHLDLRESGLSHGAACKDKEVKANAWRVNRGVDTLRTRLHRPDGSLWSRRDSSRALRPVPGWCGARPLVGKNGATRAPTVAEWLGREK